MTHDHAVTCMSSRRYRVQALFSSCRTVRVIGPLFHLVNEGSADVEALSLRKCPKSDTETFQETFT